MKEQILWYTDDLDMSDLFCEKTAAAHGVKINHHNIKKGEYIYLPNDSSDKVYFIMEGRVKIGSIGTNNKEITKTILNKGEIFGKLAMIEEGERRDFAYTMEKTTICELVVDEIKTMMKDNNELSLFFMRIMGNRMLKMEQRLESLVFKDSRSRIIDYLLEMYENRGERVGFEHVVRNFITHQEIANITATSRQTVTTVLNELRSDGIITFDRRRLLIRDLDKLKAEVES